MINDFKSLFNQNSTIIKNDLVVGLSGGQILYFYSFILTFERTFWFFGISISNYSRSWTKN